ncbi:hypothetical protein DXG01_013161 [Tephrocybe rancida]|nr:hypothetical protein DXG01_013161 [Tephrocybe rancida]
MSIQNSTQGRGPVYPLDSEINYPRSALISLSRKILLDLFEKSLRDTETWDDLSDIKTIGRFIEPKRWQLNDVDPIEVRRVTAEREASVREIKRLEDASSIENAVLWEMYPSHVMNNAVKLRRESRGRVPRGDNRWKSEDALLDFILLLSRNADRFDGSYLFRAN